MVVFPGPGGPQRIIEGGSRLDGSTQARCLPVQMPLPDQFDRALGTKAALPAELVEKHKKI